MNARMRKKKGTMDDESESDASPISIVANLLAAPLRVVVSKQAQKAYIGTALFASTSIVLLCISTIAYWIFYINFVPQIGFERVVHLQFGNGYPWGTALLESELASLQPYDVSVTLQLPRTPSNLAAGNFMLDLALFSQPTSSAATSANASTALISHSRRPAILTYASPLVDTANRITRMPLYVTGWQREAETLDVTMMEGIEFAKGWRNLPRSLRFEIQSEERMQVYSAKVRFAARFTGMRWVMYNWRILSFLVFSSMFWGVSMIWTTISWLFLSSVFRSGKTESERDIEKEDQGDKQIKTESDEESSDGVSAGGEEIKKEEVGESTRLASILGEADDEGDGGRQSRTTGARHRPGAGTSQRSGSSWGVQRRRSRVLGGDDDGFSVD
ncbi:hypothetical protein VTN00DRAFT_8046 [Thermoascus crustaceus]|uniref:uncharacterized protein n=1 Tax=Thermoascus crustaceus TaxID=5088 RepID=UPI0037425A15